MTAEQDRTELARRWLSRLLPAAPVIVATLWVARNTTRAILAKAGEPAVPLDDAYIHFQYARALAEGRFYAFMPGDPYTSGATSLLWPLMLAPFYLLGLRDTAIIWASWFWGFLFLGLLAVETKRLSEKLVGELPAMAAAAAVLGFGGHTWFAASGMEVTPLAYLLCRSARKIAEWFEAPDARSHRARNELVALAILAPLMRPEGTVASLLIAGALAIAPATGDDSRLALKSRLFALAALIGPATPPLINRVLTGHFATTTTMVKWLVGNPYYGGPNLWASVRGNLDTFVHTLLDGRDWSAIFIPSGSYAFAVAAFMTIPYAGVRSKRLPRALLVLLLAAGMAIPTTYLSFLWNRLRYLWPFAFAWCIALACLGRAIADVFAYAKPRLSALAAVITGAFAGLLAHHLSWTIDDVATSASAIHRQQVHLGRWARDHLPESARIGVNDTGAIAYFSGRRVFDVVGLTTPREARYWVAGAGARFEHYERLHRESPGALPTHFIVYPHWMACDAVLGRELTRATVTDQSILGGATMVAYEARYDLLHSGDLPQSAPSGRLLDELDVADLESEEAHGYNGPAGGGTDQDCVVRTLETFEGKSMADGVRDRRAVDELELSMPAGRPTYLVARLSSQLGSRVSIVVDGREIERIDVSMTSWTERRIPLPPRGSAGKAKIEIKAQDGRTFGSMHYWLYEAEG